MNNKHIELKHTVHKELTPEKIINNIQDDSCMGSDYETFRLREHLLELTKFYGLDILKAELNECEEIEKGIDPEKWQKFAEQAVARKGTLEDMKDI